MIIDLYQSNDYYTVLSADNRQDWLKLREKGIGGSEVASLLGMNPYMSNQLLYRYKMGIEPRPDISDKPYVKYGQEAEEHIRNIFALDYPDMDVQYKPNIVLCNNTYPFLRYSPDGLLYDKVRDKKGVLEVKTTTILQSMAKEKWDHRVPDNYYCQCLQGLLVPGFDFVILRALLNYNNLTIDYADIENTKNGYKQIRDYIFYRDDPQVANDIQAILNAEYDFYNNHILTGVEPPLLLPRI